MIARDTLNLVDTEFISNSAAYDGGGLYFFAEDNARIVNSVFAHNTTNDDGAALFLYSTGGRIEVLHTTIADSASNPRQGIFVWAGSIGITNTIVANHAVGIERSFHAGVYEDYNLFYANTINVSGTVTGGTHDVIGNPHFVDPVNDDYHIAPLSAAIDAGVDAGVYIDLDGNMRPFGGGFDIGAYEPAFATTPITGLVAINDSPTRLGDATMFIATVEAGDQVSYRWDFGDGSALGTYQAVTHTYQAVGIYTAIVTASNSLSTLTATTIVTVYVTPIAGLAAINSSPTALGQPTALMATISAGDFVSYTWNFGDGSATANSITTTHIYPAFGIYTASVTAQNSVSVMTATTRVTITDVPISGLTAANDSPTTIGNVTTLTATIGAGSNVTYTWDFGDGSSTMLGQVVTHTYPFSITSRFTATVAAMNSANTQSATTTIIIVPRRVYLPVVVR